MLAIYCRTSNAKHGREDYSISNQQEGGLKLAKQLGFNHKFYIDEGKSGTLLEREAFLQLITDIKKKDSEIKAVYAIDQSRIERDTDIWRFFSAECINNKVTYYPNGIEFDLNDITNKLMADLISLVNAYYAALTSKKVKMANALKTSKGKTHGSISYGYGRDLENNYVIIEEEANIVKKIFNWSYEGIGVYTIANKLNDLGVAPKRSEFWTGVTIDGMLINQLYKGIRLWNKNDPENRQETDIGMYIIEPDFWDKVQVNYKLNRKNVGAKQKFNYLLADGLLYCGICGQEYFGKKRNVGADSSYRCRGKVRNAKHVCRDNRGVSIEKMDTFIIKHLFTSKKLKEMLINAPKNDGKLNELKGLLDIKQSEKEHTTKRQNNFLNLLRNPDLEHDEILIGDYNKEKKKLEKINIEINELLEKISDAENTQRNEKVKTIIESYIEDIDFDTLKRLISELIERIEVHHEPYKKSGYFIFKISYKNYDEVSIFTSNWKLLEFSWNTRYRNQATSEDELEEDRENQKALLEYHGIKLTDSKLQEIATNMNKTLDEMNLNNPYSDSFLGSETSESVYEKISLKMDELIHVN